MEYFVCMIDLGKYGREAVVDPEMTRRGAIELVRERLERGCGIAFVHRITMNDVPEDVTAELIAEAEQREDA